MVEGRLSRATRGAAIQSARCARHGAEPVGLRRTLGGHSGARAIAENGDPDRGIALAMQALAAMQAIQSRHFLCYLLGLPADACPKAGATLQR